MLPAVFAPSRDLPMLYGLYCDRRAEAAGQHAAWTDLALVYDGGLVTRIAEVDEVAESAVPNLISQGINGYTRQYADTQPGVESPVVGSGRAARQRAADRVRAYRGWMQHSKMSVADYQRGRYYFGYGAMPAVLRPHPSKPGIPVWHILNPMGVLPGPRLLPYSPEVDDCFNATQRSAKWVRDMYGVTFGRDVQPDTMLEVVEYIDAEQVTVFCVGPATKTAPAGDRLTTSTTAFGAGRYGGYWSEFGTHVEKIGGDGGWLVPLSATPNYAGRCTVSHPGAISLSKVEGLVTSILSKHKLQARVMAMLVRGIAKGIHPNEWVVLDPTNPESEVVVQADGLRGIVGVIKGADIKVTQATPTYLAQPLLDRLESYQRSEAGVTPELGGESSSNIRTGARGDRITALAIEPVVREAHEIAQVAREHEIAIGGAIAKGYGGGRKTTFYVTEGRDKRPVTYVPNDLFETDEVTVRYSVTGSSASALIVEAGQSIGTEMMSKHDARLLNPLVEDVDATEAQIRAEAAEAALLSSLQQLVTTSPDDAAWITRELRAGNLPEDVWEGAQKRAQERQASAGPVGSPLGPGEPGSPETQPGLAPPGAGAEVPEVVPQAPQSLRNLAQLAVATRSAARPVPQGV